MISESLAQEAASTDHSWRGNLLRSWRYMTLRKKCASATVLSGMTISALLDLLVISAVFPIVASLSGNDASPMTNGITRFLVSVWQRGVSQSPVSVLILFAAILLLKTLLQITIRYVIFRCRIVLNVEVTADLLRRYLMRPYILHRQQPTSRLVRDINEAGILVVHQLGPFSSLLSELVLLLSTLVFFLFIAPLMTFVLLVVGICLVLLFDRLFSRVSVKQGRIRLNEDELKLRRLTDVFMGFQLIKKSRLEDRAYSEISMNIRKSVSAHESIGITGEILPLVMEASVIIAICVAVTTSQLVGAAAEPNLLPVLSLFAVGVLRVIPSIGRITSSIQYLNFWSSRNASLLADLTSPGVLGHRESLPQSHSITVETSSARTRLELKDIKFRFDGAGHDTLRDVSLELRSCETLGLVGPSGCGKSTLLEIIAGLLMPKEGSILLQSGTDTSLSQDDVALVPQGTFLFSTSIRENLQMNSVDEAASDAELWNVLRIVELDDLVKSNPRELDQQIGEGGLSLSGGQVQRVGIARALLAHPTFLLLDEATNALEEELEERIIYRIRQSYPEVAMLIVSHRASTLALCDRIEQLNPIQHSFEGVRKTARENFKT